MKLDSHHFKRLLGAALLPLVLPVSALAAACPTATLDQILALGNCTIGDATFGFTNAHLPPHPVYFNGPFAGNTGLGVAATAITFTPDATAGNPGFTLSGDFRANGQALRNSSFRGGLVTGNFYDEVLSYLEVTPGAGMGLSGYSIGLVGAQVTQSGLGSYVSANINSAFAGLDDAGYSQLSNSAAFASLVLGTQLFDSNIRTYERSPDPAAVARFSAIRYGFSEVSTVAAVPEPSSYALMLCGLAMFTTVLRRRGR